MPATTRPKTSARTLSAAFTLAFGVLAMPACRSSARDDYMASRNIRIAPTEAGDEPPTIADSTPADPPQR